MDKFSDDRMIQNGEPPKKKRGRPRIHPLPAEAAEAPPKGIVCPGCGHIQAVEDFRQYKDQGAGPNSATCECIGRYSDGKSWTNDNPRKNGGPCDYAGYGLLRISPVTVMDGEKVIRSFAFAEAS